MPLAINIILLITFVVKIQYQVIVMFAIAFTMSCLLIYMFFYMYVKSRHEKKHDKWRLISDLLIRKAVFYDEDDDDIEEETTIPLTQRAKKLMRNKHFRKLLTEEIMSAKRNITGTSADNLKQLYIQLQLEKYAFKKLKSRYWHIKAKAIQELTVMEINEFVSELYNHTNNQNELVRMEAQTAIIQFNGFEGLKFLDIVTYPISDWQQIKLLQQLALVPPANISIASWLSSANSSVVVFALKLARNYHRFELHDEISPCLDHPDLKVRLEAVNFFNEIFTEDTSDEFIGRFLKSNPQLRLAMVKAMQSTGSEKDIPFLLDLLNEDDTEIKINAARALAKIGKSGLTSLQEYASMSGYPLNEIVMQIEGELAA
jgi:hypothetical protein